MFLLPKSRSLGPNPDLSKIRQEIYKRSKTNKHWIYKKIKAWRNQEQIQFDLLIFDSVD